MKANPPAAVGRSQRERVLLSDPSTLLKARLVALDISSGAKALPPHVGDHLLARVATIVATSQGKLTSKLDTLDKEITQKKRELHTQLERRLLALDQETRQRRETIVSSAIKSLDRAVEKDIDLKTVGEAFLAKPSTSTVLSAAPSPSIQIELPKTAIPNAPSPETP